jgi:hypothetical protein
VESELAEVLKRSDFDQTKWLRGASEALDAIMVFWKGLDQSRRQLVATAS